MKRTVTLLMVLVIGITTLMSCGGDKGPSGRYQLTSIEVDGEDLYKEFKDAGMDMDGMYIEFSGGNKYKMAGLDEEDEGTYQLKGNKLIFDNIAMEGKIEGKKITCEENLEDGTHIITVFEKK